MPGLENINVLNVDVNSLIINRSSIRRYRQIIRESKYQGIREKFKDINLKSIVVHWDGKLLPNLLNTKKVDRLPVIITSGDVEIMLGIPQLENSTGENQAMSIYETLYDWGFCESVKAICCDTTASNLGYLNGAAVNLERYLKKDLLYLPCRHHIFELVLRSVFEKMIPNTNGPNVPLFNIFKDSWENLNKSNHKSGIQDQQIMNILRSKIDNIKSFITALLNKSFPRDDYEELLELVLVFLGGIPDNYHFRKPGACHHARWMAKALYVLKIFLFRDEFFLQKGLEEKLRNVCIFIVTVYVKAWFASPLAVKAPNHDLQFLKELHRYQLINKDISKASLNKFKNHLWYIQSELSVMALFDTDVSTESKLDIIKNFKKKSTSNVETEINDDNIDHEIENSSKRYELQNIDDLMDKEIDFFVSPQSMNFFDRFQLKTGFLAIHPSEWVGNQSYKDALNVVMNLRVVNDCAERAVKLMEDYSNKFTKDEKQQQYIVQIVRQHREIFPTIAKTSNLTKKF